MITLPSSVNIFHLLFRLTYIQRLSDDHKLIIIFFLFFPQFALANPKRVTKATRGVKSIIQILTNLCQPICSTMCQNKSKVLGAQHKQCMFLVQRYTQRLHRVLHKCSYRETLFGTLHYPGASMYPLFAPRGVRWASVVLRTPHRTPLHNATHSADHTLHSTTQRTNPRPLSLWPTLHNHITLRCTTLQCTHQLRVCSHCLFFSLSALRHLWEKDKRTKNHLPIKKKCIGQP